MKIKFCLLLLCWLIPWLPGRLWHWGIALIVLWLLVLHCRQKNLLPAATISSDGLRGYQAKGFWLVCVLVVCSAFITSTGSTQQLPINLHKQVLLVSGCYQLVKGDQLPGVIEVSNPRMLLPSHDRTATHFTRYAFEQSKIKLNIYDKPMLARLKQQPYGRLHGQIKLSKPANYNNHHSFDYVAWNQHQGLLGNGYIKDNLILWDGCYAPFSQARHALHKRLLQRLDYVPVSDIGKALWQALITGNTQAIDSQDWQVLQRTGSIHLFIISGLHVGLVAGFVALLLHGLLFFLPSPVRTKIVLLAGCAAGLSFAWLSGFGMPAQRASIMLVFAMLGQYMGIAWPLLQRLLIAFCLTLWLMPSSLYQQGFWFSYIAVANLAFIWQKYTHLTSSNIGETASTRSWLFVWGLKCWQGTQLMLSNQLGLLCLLTPIVGMVTGGISVIGPLVNLLLIPLFALFLVPVLLVLSILLILAPWPDVSPMMLDTNNQQSLSYTDIVIDLASYMDSVLQWLWQQLSTVSSWPMAYINVAQWPDVIWLLWVLIGLAWLGFGIKMWLPLLAMLMLGLQPLDKPFFRLSVLDVGQGLAIWVQSDKHNMLYDLGDYFSSGFNHMQAVVVPELQGVDYLDKVYISHWDKDHSGGMVWLSQANHHLPVKQWILPAQTHEHYEHSYFSKDQSQSLISRCHNLDWHTFGAVKIRHLSTDPAPASPLSSPPEPIQGNNGSCVIQIQIGDRRILLPGDIEKETEAKLVSLYGEQLRSDILLSPHHGSKTSSSAIFLQAVKPKIVIISAGKDNRFNHPHKSVLESYKSHDIVWYSTAQHGRIDVSVNDNKAPWVIQRVN